MMGVKERFIDDTLEKQGQRMLTNQGIAIKLAYERRTGRLLDDRRISVSDGKLTFQHPIYERFLDLKAKGRKDRRIHNRFVFGTYSAIARNLMYGLAAYAAEEIGDRIKEENTL